MINSCGSEDPNSEETFISNESIDQQYPKAECPVTVHETVCVNAEVIITPDVKIGDIKFFCSDESIIERFKCRKLPKKACSFEVSQKICVEIPLIFSAKAKAEPKGIFCGIPEKGECSKKNNCKRRIDFVRTIFKGTIFKAFLKN